MNIIKKSQAKEVSLQRLLLSDIEHPFLIAFLVSFFVALYRIRSRIIEPYLWAEDGWDYFKVAFCEGELGLFKPVAGLLMPLQRLVAWLIFSFTPFYSAELVTVFSVFVFCLCTSYIAKKSFRPLITSDLLRLLLAVMAPLSMGSGELLGRLTCLPYVLTWGLFLHIIELRLGRFNWKTSSIFVLITLSNPMAICALPVLVSSWHKIFNQVKYYLVVSVFGNFLVSFYCSRFTEVGTVKVAFPGLVFLLKETIESFLCLSIVVPFLGLGLSNILLKTGETALLAVGLIILFALLLIFYRYSKENLFLISAWLVPVTYSAAHLVSRTYSINPVYLEMIPALNRFLFLFVLPTSLIAFCLVKFERPLSNSSSILPLFPSIMLLLMFIPSAFLTWEMPDERAAPSWARFKRALALDPARINTVIDVPPLGITEQGEIIPSNTITVTSDGENVSCVLRQ